MFYSNGRKENGGRRKEKRGGRREKGTPLSSPSYMTYVIGMMNLNIKLLLFSSKK